ncbi:MAG: peptidoglycan-binding protein, partial [Spirosoma sp.]|nr:peptidoglycan-binding protein [Spirosoma sp.]
LIGYFVLAQTSTPTVPEQVTFANLTVRFDADARRIVQQDVDALLANRQYWTAKLDRVALYFPLIEAILFSENVPSDFKYLAVQESSLTPDAVSSSAAVGYWQFKRETATANGLRVDDQIDERKSIIASTHGAATYLKKSNAQFNNWVASLYSYYLGAGGIARLIPPEWPYAREVVLDSRTDRYILRFFAHKIAIEGALKFHQASNRFALLEYPGGSGKTVPAIAEELGVDEFELRKYNRWLLGESVPTDRVYAMAIPVQNDQINDVRQKIGKVSGRMTPAVAQTDVGFPVLRRVMAGSNGKNDPALYEINGLPGIQAQAGDNAASLARKAKLSLSSFLRYNDLDESDPILANDVYYLTKKRRKAQVPFHTVREGETTRSISQRYALRLKKLLRYNRLEPDERLVVGRVLWLSERRPANKPVEIINSPTAPVYDRTPSSAVRDVVANTPVGSNRPVSGSDGIPRTPSERKLYQPKLIGGGITPNDGTSAPAAVQRQEPPRPTRQPVTTLPPATRPAMVGSSTNISSASSEGSQRIVIVRSPEITQASAEPVSPLTSSVTTRPLYPADPRSVEQSPARERPTVSAPSPDNDTAGSSVTVTMDSPTRNQPVKTSSSSDQSRRSPQPTQRHTTETSGYNGPSEQQADGSLTVLSPKAPPRPPAPGAVKPDPTLGTSDIVKAETKPVVPSAPASNRPTTQTPLSGSSSSTMHTVEPGQTYYSISRQYGLTVDELLAMNNRTTANVLETGQHLTVRAVSTAKPTVGNTVQGTLYHTVEKGETMFRVSKLYNVSIEQIQEWNNLSDVGVKEGQKLKIVKSE